MRTIEIYRNENGFPLFDLNQVGKMLFSIGHKKFMGILRNKGFILNNNTPSQPMLSKGFMEYKLKEIACTRIPVPVTLVTVEGLHFLKRAILKSHLESLSKSPLV
jgi:hypothetical protein